MVNEKERGEMESSLIGMLDSPVTGSSWGLQTLRRNTLC